MYRIASGTTLGVLPICTRRGVAVSYYDVKAEARAILADIIIKCVLLLFSYTCTGTALPQKIRAARHPTRHRGGRLRQRFRVYIRGKEKGGEVIIRYLYSSSTMRQHAERARHAVLFQRMNSIKR